MSDDAHPTSSIGHALTTADDASREAAGAASPNNPPRSTRTLASRLLDYSAHAAMIVGLVGFAWTVSNHIVKRPTAAQLEATAPVKAKPNDLADLRQTNRQMAEDIRHLRSSLDALRASVREDRTPAQVKILQAGLENVKSGLTAARSETTTAVAQLSGKLERIEHETVAKPQASPEHVAKLEKNGLDATVTGSIPPVPAKVVTPPLPPVKPGSIAKSVPSGAKQDIEKANYARPTTAMDVRRMQDERRMAVEPTKPPVLSNYVVRDVYDGVALIEGRRGPMEVVPGVSIPGAGVVRSIERHGGGWTVVTSRGLLAYAAPPREYRRARAHDYGQPYPYDF